MVHVTATLRSKREDESEETGPPVSRHKATRGWRPGFRSSLWVVEPYCPRPQFTLSLSLLTPASSFLCQHSSDAAKPLSTSQEDKSGWLRESHCTHIVGGYGPESKLEANSTLSQDFVLHSSHEFPSSAHFYKEERRTMKMQETKPYTSLSGKTRKRDARFA